MKGLSLVQVEQLKQIGEYLLQVREKQSISLERVAKDTFIPLRLLTALEAGESDRLPEPVYIKGFIRRYADALGLDGTEIADAFDIDPPSAKLGSDAGNGEPAVRESVAAPVSVDPRPMPPQKPSSSRQGKPLTLVYALSGIAALGVVGAIAYGAVNASRSSISQPPATQTSAPVSQNTDTAQDANKDSNPGSPPASDSGSAASPPSENNPTSPEAGNAPSALAPSATGSKTASDAPVQVDISLTDRSWMEVVADGKVKFEGILSKGEQRTWTAQNSLQIRAGNAGAVVASYNQGQSKPLGKLGDVVDASFSREDEKLRSATP
ncbi:MAG: DUF4115 domain-containing protein [Leptolyngbyaceae cyanobacterium bins.302]|nr:DUF4115 domain-containing protein [Leptolyngbyaceae cyanobacterium bins.302]